MRTRASRCASRAVELVVQCALLLRRYGRSWKLLASAALPVWNLHAVLVGCWLSIGLHEPMVYVFSFAYERPSPAGAMTPEGGCVHA